MPIQNYHENQVNIHLHSKNILWKKYPNQNTIKKSSFYKEIKKLFDDFNGKILTDNDGDDTDDDGDIDMNI